VFKQLRDRLWKRPERLALRHKVKALRLLLQRTTRRGIQQEAAVSALRALEKHPSARNLHAVKYVLAQLKSVGTNQYFVVPLSAAIRYAEAFGVRQL
jgi:ribosomal protein S12 methylthiotransferase accessory factor YcaO